MPRVTMASLQAEITALRASIANAPAAEPQAATFYKKADIEAGIGFPCVAKAPCGRFLRTSKRATIHGVDLGGHAAR